MTTATKEREAKRLKRETKGQKQVRHHHEEPLVEPPTAPEQKNGKEEHPRKDRLWYWEGLFHDTLDY